jgi:WD40 repeat protein
LFSGNKISILDYKNSYTGSLLSNDELKDVKFGKNPYELFGVTNDAIYEWDLRNYKPVKIEKTFLGYSTLEVSKDYLCTGSKLGMIYIYENLKSNPDHFPLHKEVTNLTTTITHLSVNRDQGLVCALSKWKQNASRVVELNSGRCIGGWPTTKTKIQFGNVGAFCGDSDMFAVGSSNGFINIFNF